MTTNIKHYNTESLSPELQKQVEDEKLAGPCFIGQGLSKRVGSDCYGYYVVASKKVGSKTIWGIARANQVMHGDWTEGDMDCSIDMSNAEPYAWITKYGKRWYFCDANGKRYAGEKCFYHWNGAFGYQDPNF